MAQAASEHQMKSAREEAEKEAAAQQADEEKEEEEKKEADKVQLGVPIAKRNTESAVNDKGYAVAASADEMNGKKQAGPGASGNAEDAESDEDEEETPAAEITVDFKPDIDDINKKIELHLRTLDIRILISPVIHMLRQ